MTDRDQARLLACEDTVLLARELVRQLRGTNLPASAHARLSELEDQLTMLDDGSWLPWYTEQLARRPR